MKITAVVGSAVVAVVAITTITVSGCARTRVRIHETASLQTLQGDLQYARQQTDQSVDALDEIEVAPPEDLEAAVRTLSGDVDALGTIGRRLIRHDNGLRSYGTTYIVEPEKSVTECRYPRLSESARTQPMQLGEAFGPIEESSRVVRHAYRAYYFDVTQIRDSLLRDTVPGRVETLDPIFRKARVDGESFKQALDRALSAIEAAKLTQPPPEAGQVPEQQPEMLQEPQPTEGQ